VICAWERDQTKILSIRERLGPFFVCVLHVIYPWSWVSVKPTAGGCVKVASRVLAIGFGLSFRALIISASESVSLKSPPQITKEVSLSSIRSMMWSMLACARSNFGSVFVMVSSPVFWYTRLE
jgi:hypothetical protein